MLTIRKILHPTDFSDDAGNAFRLACSLARDHGAQVIVLHVMPPPVCWGEVLARRPPDSYEDQLWREYLEPMCAAAPGVHIEARIEQGDPAERIAWTAEQEGCDLIVMGTHGRSGLGRMLMGSVTESVLRNGSCPVLTLRAPQGSFPANAPVEVADQSVS